MNTTELSDFARNNKVAMIAHFIDAFVMLLFCILQATSGMVTRGYILLVTIIGMAPVTAEYCFRNKNKETQAIKHLAAIGFAVFTH